MEKAEPSTKKNKILGVSVTILNVIVFLVVLGLSRTYPLPAGIFAAIYFSIILGMAINKQNTLKTNGGDTTAVKREIKGYVAWIIFIAVVLAVQVWSVGGFQPTTISSSNPSPTELASQGAQQAKSSTKLPYEVDAVTTLNDFTSDGNTIQYHYTLHDADTTNVSDDTLKAIIKPNVCSNTSTKQLLDNGVNMQYLYTVKETNAQYSFTVSQTDC